MKKLLLINLMIAFFIFWFIKANIQLNKNYSAVAATAATTVNLALK